MIEWVRTKKGMMFCDIGCAEEGGNNLGCYVYLCKDDEGKSMTLKKFVSAHSPLHERLVCDWRAEVALAFSQSDMLLLEVLTRALHERTRLRFWEGFTDRVMLRTLLNEGTLISCVQELCGQRIKVFKVDYGFDVPAPLFSATLLRVVDVDNDKVLWVSPCFKLPEFYSIMDGYISARPYSLFCKREDNFVHGSWERVATFTDEKDVRFYVDYQRGKTHVLPDHLLDCMTFHSGIESAGDKGEDDEDFENE